MFIACATRTMANAKPILQDNKPPRVPHRRAKLIELASRWREEQARKQEEGSTLAQTIDSARRKHRRTRPSIRGDNGPCPRELISMVAAWHGLTYSDILGKSRAHVVIAARFDAVAAVYGQCRMDGRKYSLGELGRLFKRDHTTALWALKRMGMR